MQIIIVIMVGFYSYMTSAFFTKATIGSVSSAIIFLMTFMPYIVIVSVGSAMTTTTKIVMVSCTLEYIHWEFV